MTGSSTDFLTGPYHAYTHWVDGLSDPFFGSVFRCAVALIFSTILCGLTLRHASENLNRGGLLALQWICAVLALFVALELPIDRVELEGAPKGFIFAVSIFAIVVLPWRLAFVLTPIEMHRRRLAKSIYAAIGLLFVIGWITS